MRGWSIEEEVLRLVNVFYVYRNYSLVGWLIFVYIFVLVYGLGVCVSWVYGLIFMCVSICVYIDMKVKY